MSARDRQGEEPLSGDNREEECALPSGSEDLSGSNAVSPPREDGIVFAHPSEEEFARILDFYHVEWSYEPTTFPIEWDSEGNVTSAFTPDFYLPEQELFIEITTLRQALVTKKNRKIRRLRELYPEVNIRILYASDFRKLIEKFVASGRLNAHIGTEHKRSRSDWENGAQK